MPRFSRKLARRLLTVSLLLSTALFGSVSYAQEKETTPASQEQNKERVQTLQSVLAWTYLNNPTLQAARTNLKSVQEQLPQAYANWLPNIEANAGISDGDFDSKPDGTFGSGSGSTEKNIGVSFEQSLYRGGRSFAQTKVARAVIMAQTAEVLRTEQDLMRAAAQAYMDVFRDRSLLELAQNNQDVISKQLEATQDRFEVGELTKTDVSQAQARLASASADIITAKGNLRASEAVFEQIIGFRPERLEYPYDDLGLPSDLDEALFIADSQSPAIAASIHAHRAAEEDINNVFGALLPQVGISGNIARAYDPNPGILDRQTSRNIGISASIPLYQGGATRSKIRSAKHTANERYIQILEQRKAIKQSAVQAWEAFQSASAEAEARKAQIKASAIAQEGVRAEAEFGSRTVLDTLDADQEFLDANVALVTAQRNKIVAEYQLLAILGDLTPQKLGFEKDSYDYHAYLNDLKWRLFDMDVDRLGK